MESAEDMAKRLKAKTRVHVSTLKAKAKPAPKASPKPAPKPAE